MVIQIVDIHGMSVLEPKRHPLVGGYRNRLVRLTGPGGADDHIGKVSQPHREEAQRYRQGDVAEGLGPLTGPQEVERLQAEGGEGRIAAAHAHDEERARFQSRKPGSTRKGIDRRQEADEERSRHVHGNRSPGERIPERSGN